MADDGRVRKQEEDFTAAVDVALPEAVALATVARFFKKISSNFCRAVGCVMRLKGCCRSRRNLALLARHDLSSRLQACDVPSTTRILVAIVTMCYDAHDWQALGEYVVLLSKRRGQLKQVWRYKPRLTCAGRCQNGPEGLRIFGAGSRQSDDVAVVGHAENGDSWQGCRGTPRTDACRFMSRLSAPA